VELQIALRDYAEKRQMKQIQRGVKSSDVEPFPCGYSTRARPHAWYTAIP